MRRKRFTEEQLAFALRQGGNRAAVKEIRRQLHITELTFYRRKKKFSGMGVAEVQRLKQPEDTVKR